MTIDEKSNIDALLREYPQLEEFLMGLNGKYKKLKNPILRRTVAKVATLKQVAMIGGYKPLELVNLIRSELGMQPLEPSGDVTNGDEEKSRPEWVTEEAAVTLDANEILDREENPLAVSRKTLKDMGDGEILAIESDFMPSPLIEQFEESGYGVWSEEYAPDRWRTLVLKKRS
jgi:uncharacterized protein (DUF2249 family)